MTPKPLVLACGALVSELRSVLVANALDCAVEVRYLPANLHNVPDQIVPTLIELLAQLDPDHDRPVLIAYADCGTGGQLDSWLAQLRASTASQVRRLPGAHCYEFFAGSKLFADLHDAEPGTFYLTDFLAKHFDALVWQGLGLDRYPSLRDTYFSNYRRVVLLSQSESADIVIRARRAAQQLGLAFEQRHVGFAAFDEAVTAVLVSP